MMPVCLRCEDCVSSGHHWVIDHGQQTSAMPYTYSCKHCPARAVTCPVCQGEYEDMSPQEECAVCDGLGLIPVTHERRPDATDRPV
jgi:hypothetical protein